MLCRRRNHLPWILHLRLDIRSFAGLVVTRDGSSLCYNPVDNFQRLKVLALGIWQSRSLFDFFAERTITQPVATDRPHVTRQTVRTLAAVSDLRYHSPTESVETVVWKLSVAFDEARQQFTSRVVRIPPALQEIRIKTNLTPAEFEVLQR